MLTFLDSDDSPSDPGAGARMQRRSDWTDDMARAVSGFLVIVAITKIAAPSSLVSEYARLGLEGSVRVTMGWVEMGIAGLLIWGRARTIGVILAAGASAAAAFMLLLHAKFGALLLPLALTAMLLITARRIDRARRGRSFEVVKSQRLRE